MTTALYTEKISDALMESRTALTAAIVAVELVYRHPSMRNHYADCGGILAYYRWCATHEDNPLGCLALARMARDELALLVDDARGTACALLATAQQQTERLIATLAPQVPEGEAL